MQFVYDVPYCDLYFTVYLSWHGVHLTHMPVCFWNRKIKKKELIVGDIGKSIGSLLKNEFNKLIE